MDSTLTAAVMDSARTGFSEKMLIEAIKIIPGILWFLLAVITMIVFYKPLRYELLPRIAGIKAMGLEFSFVKKSIQTAIEVAEKYEKWQVTIPEADRKRVLRRVEHHFDLFKDAAILWIDDFPEQNKSESLVFERLQAKIEFATSSQQAKSLLKKNKYDLILSDMLRNGDATAGLQFLAEYRKSKNPLPLIFYVGSPNPDKPVPLGAFGLTHRPDELLHLVMDALERVKSV